MPFKSNVWDNPRETTYRRIRDGDREAVALPPPKKKKFGKIFFGENIM